MLQSSKRIIFSPFSARDGSVIEVCVCVCVCVCVWLCVCVCAYVGISAGTMGLTHAMQALAVELYLGLALLT